MQWAIAEVAPGRLVPWLPVAFGFGIVGYFTADREPAWRAPASAALIIAFVARRRAFGFAIALGFAAVAAGFATATLKTERFAHPVRWTGALLEETAARPAGLDRPWVRGPHEPASVAQTATRPAAPDATPRAEDLEPGD